MATYATQVQWDGPNGRWVDNGDLVIAIQNPQSIVPVTGAPSPGTKVSWSGTNGDASITFNGNDFLGSLQVPGQGGVNYQGTLQSLSAVPSAAPSSFTATFNPSPNPPTSNQFSLTDAEGNSVANLVLVDAATEISITLAGEGVSFSSSPIVWSLPPDGGEPTPTVSGNTLTFTVPAPTHMLFPWVFRFIVDSKGATGIRSQNIYLANTASENPEFILKYAPDNGHFSLVDSLGSTQDGAILGDQLVMVNTQLNTFTVSLQSDPPSTPSPVFATNAIAWSSGSQPDWISVSGGGSTTLTVQISLSAALGQSIGLQFAIVLDGVTILSPDPILINSTIGDG